MLFLGGTLASFCCGTAEMRAQAQAVMHAMLEGWQQLDLQVCLCADRLGVVSVKLSFMSSGIEREDFAVDVWRSRSRWGLGQVGCASRLVLDFFFLPQGGAPPPPPPLKPTTKALCQPPPPQGKVCAPDKISMVTVPPATVWGHVSVWDFLTKPSTLGFGHLF